MFGESNSPYLLKFTIKPLTAELAENAEKSFMPFSALSALSAV
jgi:hypothetical protein